MICPVCKSNDVRQKYASTLIGDIDYRISENQVGLHSEIKKCGVCGLGFVVDFDTLSIETIYKNSPFDDYYEKGRKGRLKAASKLLNLLPKKKNMKLLDVGCYSGILMESAMQKGYVAEGIKPSKQAVDYCKKVNIGRIYKGTYADVDSIIDDGKYDVITLIDVIEHVSDPIDLMRFVAYIYTRFW